MPTPTMLPMTRAVAPTRVSWLPEVAKELPGAGGFAAGGSVGRRRTFAAPVCACFVLWPVCVCFVVSMRG